MGRNIGKGATQDVGGDRNADSEWYASTFKNDTVLLGSLQRHVVISNERRDADRDTAHLHASEICKTDWCPRSSTYRILGYPAKEAHRGTHHVINLYEEGHSIHEKYQKWLWEMGVLQGVFVCAACQHRWWATAPEVCASCDSPHLRYGEVPIEDESIHLMGHADGQVGDDLIEFKSIGLGSVRMEVPGIYRRYSSGEITVEKLWNEIRRPFPSHTRQAMLYLRAKGIKRMVFIYEAKWNQQQKEFLVTYTPGVIDNIVQSALKVKELLAEGRLAPRPEWAEEDHKVCKKCPYVGLCWRTESNETTGEEVPAGGDLPERPVKLLRRRPR
jgi:CRISPR/Cas system-associated exonuclease Cas4 (RecB family)